MSPYHYLYTTILSHVTGMKDYLERYAGAIQTISKDLETNISWDPKDRTELIAQLDEMVPKDQLQVCGEGL